MQLYCEGEEEGQGLLEKWKRPEEKRKLGLLVRKDLVEEEEEKERTRSCYNSKNSQMQTYKNPNFQMFRKKKMGVTDLLVK